MNLAIEPNLLLILGTLLKTRSVSEAANALGVSQPSVSRALARLREQLKDPLLVRSGNAMIPTARGEELTQRLADWMVLTDQVLHKQQFSPQALERRFRVGSTDFGVQTVLKPALQSIRDGAPGSTLEIVPLEWSTHYALASGKLDLAVSGLDSDPKRLHRHLLFRDSFHCLMDKEHELAQADAGKELTLEEYLAHPHVSMVVSDTDFDRIGQRLGKHASERRVTLSTSYFSLASELMDKKVLLTLPGRAAAHHSEIHGLVQRPAPRVLGDLDYWLLWHERSHRDPATDWLRSRIIEAASHN